jgi:hypothetical protein
MKEHSKCPDTPPDFEKSRRQGMALFVVMGLLAVFVPVLMFLSQMGGSQVRRAVRFHETLQAEAAALSGMNSAFCRLRGGLEGYQGFRDLSVGDQACDITMRPTGKGIFMQNLYYLFAQSYLGNHCYTLMTDTEQFPGDPNPPVLVIPHDFWNNLDPYDIGLVADQTSLENYRGEDILRLEETKKYEQDTKRENYREAMKNKSLNGLPVPLQNCWEQAINIMTEEKLN